MKYVIIISKYIIIILALFLIITGTSHRKHPPSQNHHRADNTQKAQQVPPVTINETFRLVTIDETINLYGQIVNGCEASNPLPNITLKVENTGISCITGKEGDYMLPNVPIREQRINFYDANNEYISSVNIFFNIDKGNLYLNSLEIIILDVGNSDGRLFTNMQLGFDIDVKNRLVGYDPTKTKGNVETLNNRTIYFVICIMFVVIFFLLMIMIDRKRSVKERIKDSPL